MKEAKRRFRLKNGLILEALESEFPWFEVVGDFQDPARKELFFKDGEAICLWEEDEGLPTGGAFGPEYDIVEEIFNEVQ